MWFRPWFSSLAPSAGAPPKLASPHAGNLSIPRPDVLLPRIQAAREYCKNMPEEEGIPLFTLVGLISGPVKCDHTIYRAVLSRFYAQCWQC